MKKTDLPLIVLEALEPFLEKRNPRYNIVKAPDVLLRFNDANPDSNFYFQILKTSYEKGKTYFVIQFLPSSQQQVAPTNKRIESQSLETHLDSWALILDGYKKVKSIYDDPIIEKNVQEFEEMLKISDEDADTVGFSVPQIEYLDENLEKVRLALEAFKVDDSEYNIEEVEELQLEVKKIRSILTKETKSQIIKKVSVLLAKAKKVGLPILKEVAKSLILDFLKGGLALGGG